jgi:hypothetical protein
MPTEAEVGASGGSSDMGNVSQVVPSIHPMLAIDGGGRGQPPEGVRRGTITTSGEQAIRDGALAMAWTIIDMAEPRTIWASL